MQSLQKKFQIKFYLFIKDYSTGLITKIAAGHQKNDSKENRYSDIDIDSKYVIKSMICAVGFTR